MAQGQTKQARPRQRSHITIDMPKPLIAELDRLAADAYQGRSAYLRALILKAAQASRYGDA
jgi:metal-responsive CopG/Arc/MetJ family transcriptional regulator